MRTRSLWFFVNGIPIRIIWIHFFFGIQSKIMIISISFSLATSILNTCRQRDWMSIPWSSGPMLTTDLNLTPGVSSMTMHSAFRPLVRLNSDCFVEKYRLTNHIGTQNDRFGHPQRPRWSSCGQIESIGHSAALILDQYAFGLSMTSKYRMIILNE